MEVPTSADKASVVGVADHILSKVLSIGFDVGLRAGDVLRLVGLAFCGTDVSVDCAFGALHFGLALGVDKASLPVHRFESGYFLLEALDGGITGTVFVFAPAAGPQFFSQDLDLPHELADGGASVLLDELCVELEGAAEVAVSDD